MQKAELPFDGETTAAAKFARAAAEAAQCNVMILIQRRLSSRFLHSSWGCGFLQDDCVHFEWFKENYVPHSKKLVQFYFKIFLTMLLKSVTKRQAQRPFFDSLIQASGYSCRLRETRVSLSFSLLACATISWLPAIRQNRHRFQSYVS